MSDSEINVHPAAAVFPMLSDDELADLAEDIKANGLFHSIKLDKDGRIVDGRNRDAACRRAGVEPRYETFSGDDEAILAYILSANVRRRHMAKGALAMATVEAVFITNTSASRDERSELADLAGVSANRITRALVVRRHAPDLVENVISGATTLDAAYDEARKRKDAASSMGAQLGALRIEAPDLADLVVEERLTLREALEVLARRRADERRRKEAATTGLLSALRLLAPPAGDIVEHADNLLASLDPSLVSGGELIASAAVERAIAFLEVVLVGLDEREGQHGSTQAQSVPS